MVQTLRYLMIAHTKQAKIAESVRIMPPQCETSIYYW